MTDTLHTPIEVTLSYFQGEDDPERQIFATRPVDPEFTSELQIDVHIDDDSVGTPSALQGKQLQVEFAGSARALEAFGTYLLALARLQSSDPDPHEHFEDVQDATGHPLHLIVRRTGRAS